MVGSGGTGVIRSPGGRRTRLPRTAPPTSSWSSSTTSASPNSAATAPISPPRRSTAWPPAASVWPTSGPRRCARRPGPACSPGGTTIAAAWDGWPTWPRASPATAGSRPRRTATCRRSCGRTATPPTPWGSGTSPPTTRPTWRRPATTWPLVPGLRPLVRLPRGGDPSVRPRPLPRQPFGPAGPFHRGRLPPERRPGRPGHRVPRRPAGGRRRPTVLPLLLHRCLPLAPPGAPAVDRPLPGPVRRRLGRLAGADLRPPAGAGGDPARAPASRPGRRGCRPGTSSGRPRRTVASRFMECFAGFLSYTDAQIGRLVRFLEDTGDLENTVIMLVSDNGASAEGGPEGSINDIRLTNLDPAGTAEMHERLDEIGGPLTHNNYPWGWTMAGNTPFKRWKREVHQGGVADPCIISWPARLSESAGAIRHQFVHAIDVLPTVLELVGIEAPDGDRVRPPDPHRRDRLRLPAGARGGGRRPNGTRPSISRCSARGPSTTRVGRRSPTTRWVPSTTTGSVPTPRSTRTSGSSTTWPRICPRRTTWPPSTPTGWPRWWSCGGRRPKRNQVLPLDNRVLWVLTNPKPHQPPRTDVLPLLPRWGPGAGSGGRQRPEPLPRHTVKVEVPEAHVALRGAPGPRLGPRGVVAAPPRRPSALRPQPLRQASLRDREPTSPRLRARTPCGSRFEKDDRRGGDGVLLIDGRWWPKGSSVASPRPASTASGWGSPAATNGDRPSATATWPRSPSTGPSPTPWWKRPGPVVRDPLAEIAAIMSEQ